MTPWRRLWREMPTDPKWRTVAKKAGRPLSEVVSLFTLMITVADDTGSLGEWCNEDAASALDLEVDAVAAIHAAMQGKALDGNTLTGWASRQPKREDHSTERVRAFRAKAMDEKRGETLSNAVKRPREEKIREEKKERGAVAPSHSKGSRLSADWTLPAEWRNWAATECEPRLSQEQINRAAATFADHWRSKAGKDGVKSDWEATWRNWCRRERQDTPTRKAAALRVVTDDRGATGFDQYGNGFPNGGRAHG